MLILLFRYWQADTKYALAHNLNGTNQAQYLQQSYTLLQDAYGLWPHETTILDELSQTSATLAMAFYGQKDSASAAQFTTQAVGLSDTLVNSYPYNVVLWKNRVRILYSLSQVDPKYLPQAVAAIDQAVQLAPTDAKILYNQGVLYGQTGKLDRGIAILEKTATYRPQYRDPHFALALFYREKATENSERVIHPAFEKKAVDELYYILQKLGATDAPSLQLLDTWKEPKPTNN
jgi:tetratricopeptide (TPR) repeat protein